MPAEWSGRTRPRDRDAVACGLCGVGAVEPFKPAPPDDCVLCPSCASCGGCRSILADRAWLQLVDAVGEFRDVCRGLFGEGVDLLDLSEEAGFGGLESGGETLVEGALDCSSRAMSARKLSPCAANMLPRRCQWASSRVAGGAGGASALGGGRSCFAGGASGRSSQSSSSSTDISVVGTNSHSKFFLIL